MEEWRDIKGFEGLYQVSNKGNVKSLERKVWCSRGRGYYRTVPEKILKASKKGRGYLSVTLSKDGIDDDYYVHQLVACAFIPNPHGYKELNHIDENKENNCVENLEYCTRAYNINYGTRNEKISKAVIGINKTSGLIVEFSSTMEAERQLGIAQQNICACCKGRKKSVGGFYWMYAEEEN